MEIKLSISFSQDKIPYKIFPGCIRMVFLKYCYCFYCANPTLGTAPIYCSSPTLGAGMNKNNFNTIKIFIYMKYNGLNINTMSFPI